MPDHSTAWRVALPVARKLQRILLRSIEASLFMAQRKVLLAVRTGHIDQRLLASARSLCQRLDADLDILLLTPDDRLPVEMEAFVKTLLDEGVAYCLTRKSLLRRRDIVQYANSHECIATVVIDSLEGWQSVAEDRSSNPWAKLSCPLVTAATKSTESP